MVANFTYIILEFSSENVNKIKRTDRYAKFYLPIHIVSTFSLNIFIVLKYLISTEHFLFCFDIYLYRSRGGIFMGILNQLDSWINHQLSLVISNLLKVYKNKKKKISSISMELSILTQQTVRKEILLSLYFFGVKIYILFFQECVSLQLI